ncbi:hypothetical protein DSO57_1011748 [Entomophthora muscae]|uniref:Uncharacterized protein n=1 Tax=Entomophthora muscae TaxID=34485 RepID=A0ACC2U4J7_9FUNG|nr:hypothetical protein DSO57_1011748 [Entomophthora muscae]
MTPHLTPRPDRPMEPSNTTKTMSNQLFGVLYVTLTGLHPSYGGPYPLVQQYSFLIHLIASNYAWLPETLLNGCQLG